LKENWTYIVRTIFPQGENKRGCFSQGEIKQRSYLEQLGHQSKLIPVLCCWIDMVN